MSPNLVLNKLLTLLLFSVFIVLINSCVFTKAGPRTQHDNRIDGLKTQTDVQGFIDGYSDLRDFQVQKLQDIYSNYFPGDFCKDKADSLKIKKSFYKADFDKNGRTDLLAIGKWSRYFTIYTFLSFPNDSVQIKEFTRIFPSDCEFPSVKKNGDIELFHLVDSFYDIYGEYFFVEDVVPPITKKDLTFKFGFFVEKNLNPTDHKITKIEYSRGGCFGTCPSFSFELIKDGKSVFDAEMYNFEDEKKMEGVYKTQLKEAHWQELTGLLNYIDFPTLSSLYSMGHSGAPGSTLKIVYDNGKIKKISDRGLSGTFGLMQFNNLMLELRENQNWIKEK